MLSGHRVGRHEIRFQNPNLRLMNSAGRDFFFFVSFFSFFFLLYKSVIWKILANDAIKLLWGK